MYLPLPSEGMRLFLDFGNFITDANISIMASTGGGVTGVSLVRPSGSALSSLEISALGWVELICSTAGTWSVVANHPSVTQRPSDLYIEDGSYLKIRHLNLAYTLPVNKVSWIRKATVYISGENLFTFTKYPWYDPEVSAFSGADLRLGVDNKTYPQVRIFAVGFKVGF